VAGPVTVETTARAAGWQRRRRDRPRSAAVTAYRPARTEWTLRNLGDPALVGTGSTSIDTATDNAEQPSQRHPDGREPSHEPRCHRGQRREPLGHFSGTANHNVPIALSPVARRLWPVTLVDYSSDHRNGRLGPVGSWRCRSSHERPRKGLPSDDDGDVSSCRARETWCPPDESRRSRQRHVSWVVPGEPIVSATTRCSATAHARGLRGSSRWDEAEDVPSRKATGGFWRSAQQKWSDLFDRFLEA
jgi:hypothetical protein